LFGQPGDLFFAAFCACRSARSTCSCCRCCWGGGGTWRKPGGLSSLVTCSDPKLYLQNSRTTPQGQKKDTSKLTAVTPQNKNRYLCGVL
jgi:hypothetical protein